MECGPRRLGDSPTVCLTARGEAHTSGILREDWRTTTSGPVAGREVPDAPGSPTRPLSGGFSNKGDSGDYKQQ